MWKADEVLGAACLAAGATVVLLAGCDPGSAAVCRDVLGRTPDAPTGTTVVQLSQDLCRSQGYAVRACAEPVLREECGGRVLNQRSFLPPIRPGSEPPGEPQSCWYCDCPQDTMWWVPFLGCLSCDAPVDCEVLERNAQLLFACARDDDCVLQGLDCTECFQSGSRYFARGDVKAFDRAARLGACPVFNIACDGCVHSHRATTMGAWPHACVDGRCRPPPWGFAP